ncbi:MAG: adenosylcobinamide-GDP ribazoletransferase, partial [Acidimicrobiales bacterium]
MSGAVEATTFLTVVGSGGRPTPAATRWFGVVGLVLGAALGGAWVGLEHLWPAAIAAALVVLLDVGITGALHFDGLADASDGLLPHADRQRRLMIMA